MFEEEKVNVQVICGKNGCGKSTLLKLIANKERTDIEKKTFYILKDGKGKFASSTKCSLILDNKTILLDKTSLMYDFSPSTCCVNHSSMQIEEFEFRKNITKFYAERPALYDGVVEGKLFTHFTVELWNFETELEDLINGNRKQLFVNEDYFDLKMWLKDDFLSLFLLITMQDNSYDDFVKNIYDEITNYNTSLKQYFTERIYTNISPSVIEKIQEELFEKEYEIGELQNVQKLIEKLEENVFAFLNKMDGSYYEPHFVAKAPREYLYFKGYNKETKPYRYIHDLSNGEWLSLKYRYEIFHSMSQTDGFWWYIDEPEQSLHPEWCRCFLHDYLKAYNGVKKYLVAISKKNSEAKFNPNKRFTLIFATHSPFLLSDLTNNYIIYLDKTYGETKQINAEKDVFAGNIGEMYSTIFFMQNTIGEFARSKILRIIKDINNNEKVSDDTIKEWKLLISKIGDDLLKNLLTEKIGIYEKNRIK